MKFTKGLNLDSTNEDRPEGSWAHALNAIFNKEIGAVSKEGGTELAWDTNSDRYILGTGTYQDITIIFTFIANTGTEQIFLFNGIDNSIQLLFSAPGAMYASCIERQVEGTFGWSEGTQIKAVCNKNTKDELIVYWICDDFPPCVFNVDRQKRLLDAGTIATQDIYESDIALTCDIRWIDQFRLAPHAGPVPRLLGHEVVNGGSLEVATYSLALQYIMDDGSSTGNLVTTLPVAIAINKVNKVIMGSNSFDKSTAPVLTGNAIRWDFDNINIVNIKYIQPYIIKNSGNAEVGLKLTKIEIATEVDLTNRTLSITYEGLEGEALADINEIFNGNLVYSRAKAIEQFDDKLYLANLETEPIFRYQKYANAIKVEPVMEDICDFDWRFRIDGNDCYHYENQSNGPYEPGVFEIKNANTQSYRNSQYYVEKRGYKRGETYAFYIAFIKADGSMSPAYHIPGRQPISNMPSGGASSIGPENVNQNWFHQPGWILPNSNGMNYWQNQDEVYPDNDDFDTVDITSGTATVGTSNRSTPVRHHHFPHGHDVDWGSYYTGKSPWAVIQNNDNTNNPNLGSLSAATYQQVYPAAFNYVDVEYTPANGLFYVSGPNKVAHLGIELILSNWTPFYGDPNHTSLQVGGTLTLVSASYDGTALAPFGPIEVTHRIDNYGGNPNRVYLQIKIDLPSSEPIWTIFTGPNDLWNSTTVWNPAAIPPDDEGILFPSAGGTSSVSADHSWMNTFDTCSGSGCYHQAVNILGFRLKNLAVPKDIADNAQGFRIYRAKRREADKTRLDQGLASNVHTQSIRLDSKRNEVKATFQVPFYGIDGMGYRRFSGSDHRNKFYGGFAFYGFKTLRNRESLNEITDIDQIYSLNESSTYSIRGAELFVPPDGAQMKFKNDTGQDAYLTDDTSDVTCYDPWREGAQITLTGTNAMGPLQASWMDTWNGAFGTGSPWPNNGDAAQVTVGGPALFCGVYHFLSIYNQQFTSGASDRVLSGKLEYIQGNTIESLRDYTAGGDYAYNMGGCSYVLGDNFGTVEYPSAVKLWDNSANIGTATNPGSMYANYIPGNQLHGAEYYYGQSPNGTLGINYNAVDELLPDENGGNTLYSHFRVIDLYARKRNIYNDFDTQDLVFTGFEILGEEFNRFIVDVDSGLPATSHTQDLYPFDNQTGKIFGGDTFVARDDVRITFDGYDLIHPEDVNTWVQNPASHVSIFGMGANMVKHTASLHATLVSIIVESSENIALRHTTSAHTIFAPESSIDKILYGLDGVCIGLGSSCYTNKTWLGDDGHSFIFTWDQNPCLPTDLMNHKTGTNANGEEGIRYNDIYHYDSLLGNPIPVSNSIEEILTYPVRITRSITGGGVSDTYRNFPELDFMDVQTDKGSIFNLFIHTGVLMIQSEDGLYKTKGSETLNTEQGGDIYVGSGNIFANAPELVATATLGVGGTTLRFSNYSTKWGYYYIDYNRRTVNHFGETLTVISDKGLREWMQRNIPIELYDYGVPQDLELTNTLFGFSFGLDARYNRLLVTKRAYKVTDIFKSEYGTNSSGTGSDIRWNNDELRFERYDSFSTTWLVLGWNSSQYFEPDNWTLSYYPEEQIWGSFHSYWPSTYICHDSKYYGYGKSPGYAGQLWEHNSENFNRFGRYYTDINSGTASTTWPFEVMQSFNAENLSTKLFYALNVDTKWVNQDGSVEHNIGLTHYYAHTDIQVTGMRELNYMETYRGVGGSWQINDLRDRALLSFQDLYAQDGGGTQVTPVNLYNEPMFLPDSTTLLNPDYIAVGAVIAVPLGTIQGGTNYTPGTTTNYFPSSITPGSVGTGLDIDFTINGSGQLSFVSINDGGSGYQEGEIFSIPGNAQTPNSSGVGAFFTVTVDKQWHQMRRIRDRYINIFLKDDNTVKNSLTLLDSSILYKSYSR